MFTALFGLAAANIGALGGGLAIGGALEVAVPWLTRAHRARKFVRGVKAHGGTPPPEAITEAASRVLPRFRPREW